MMLNTYKFVLVALIALLVGCGGGGSGSDSSSSSVDVDSSNWHGSYHSTSEYGFGSYSDMKINKSTVSDAWVGNSRIFEIGSLKQAEGLSSGAYIIDDMRGGLFMSGDGNYAGMIYGSSAVGVYQSHGARHSSYIAEDINGNWIGRIYSEYRESIYEYPVTFVCESQFCTMDIDNGDAEIKFDFAKPYYSSFNDALGIWWGREADDGYRVFTSARLSYDKQFLVMPACWHTSGIGDDTFFDLCDMIVLERDN